MTAAAPDELLSHWSRLLVTGLARAGVRDVVISPGSRSTPFAWAALQIEGLHCHSVHDERSAAFFALGQARRSGVASAVICTSGSAAANYFPAVVEASLAHVPLIVLTADRPLELQDASAAQTIDQIKLYGGNVRRFYELGGPDEHPAALSGLLRLVQQAVAATRAPDPGPVHLNARARKPLEPPAESASSELGSRVSALLARPSLRVDEGDTAPAAPAVAALTRAIEGAERGVIVCGPEPLAAPVPAALVDLSEATGFPLLCEAPSQLRFDAAPEATPIDAFDWILRGPELEARLVPDLALRFGAPPTSPGLERLLGAAGAYHVITPHGFADAQAGAQSVTFGSSARVAAALVARLTARPRSTAFREDWSARNRSAWAAVEATLESDDAFHEGSAVRAAVEVLPHGGLLALGNSLPVREVDQYVPAGARGLRVACQRGANGIDGVVSATAGAALDFPGPSLLLVGDVSFLHDLGGLDLVRRAERALVILVLDNGGGRIFDQLPIGDHYRRRPELARFWQTPPAADLSHAAALFRIPFSEVESQAALTQALHAALERGGPSVVVARVAPESARLDVEAVSHALSSPQAR